MTRPNNPLTRLASFIAMAVLPISPVVAQPNPNDYSPLGQNLGEAVAYNPEAAFKNMARRAREWETNTGVDLTPDQLTADNYPIPGQLGRSYIVTTSGTPAVKGSDYVILWEGTGTVVLQTPGTLVTASANRAVYTIAAGSQVAVEITANSTTDPIRNIRFMRAEFESNYQSDPWNPDFVANVEKFRVLRMLTWNGVNPGSFERHWAERATPSSWGGNKRVPYEDMISVANRVNADLWLCVPHLATDDYVRQLSRLVRDNLNAARKVYVEYSNEVWNTVYPQTAYANARGTEEGLAPSAADAGLRWYSKRALQVHAIFAEEFGGAGRLVRLLANHALVPSRGITVMDFQNAYEKVDAYATGGYFTNFAAGSPPPIAGMTVPEVIATIDADLDGNWITGRLWPNRDNAAARGLPLIAYEAGQHLVATVAPWTTDATFNALLDAVNRDPGMGTLYTKALNIWRNEVGTLFTHYSSVTRYSTTGRWGAKEYEHQGPTPKFTALSDFMTANPRDEIPSIGTTTLPSAYIGVPYRQTLRAVRGDGAHLWSVVSGSLPVGLTLNSQGLISGTPTTATNASFTVRVADLDGDAATRALTLAVTTGSVPAITTAALVDGTAGTAYSQTLAATGGNGTLTWSLTSGILPAGLSLSPAGAITGTPTHPMRKQVIARATDADGDFHDRTLDLTVRAAAGSPAPYIEAGGLLAMEAENALLAAGTSFEVLNDAGASGGSFLVEDDVGGTGFEPSSEVITRLATYEFNVATAGTYALYSRIRVPGTGNSFFYRIDGEPWISLNDQGGGTSWSWVYDRRTFVLSAGYHTLQVTYREQDTQLDKFVVQRTTLPVPTGTGPAESSRGNPPVTPVMSIAASDPIAAEPGDHGSFAITATPPPPAPITVNLTRTGTATNGSDYSPIATSISVGSSGSVTIPVTVINDSADEPTESVTLTLQTGAGYFVGSTDSATVTIADDDPTVIVETIDNATALVPNSFTNGSYTGTAGLSWSYTQARSFTFDGPGIRLRANTHGRFETLLGAGLSQVSVRVKSWGSTAYASIELRLNGQLVGTSPVTNSTPVTWTVPNLGLGGAVTVEFRTPSGQTVDTIIDTITLTSP